MNKNINNISKSKLIKKIFDEMDYNANDEKLEHDTASSETTMSVPKSFDEFLKVFEQLKEWTLVEEDTRNELILKLAEDLEKNITVIAKIDKESRHVPEVFNKSVIKFLISSLEFYGNFYGIIPHDKDKSIHVCSLSESNALSILAYVLGPSLASGSKSIFIVPRNLWNSINFIKESMLRIGFPKGTIELYPEMSYTLNKKISSSYSLDVFVNDEIICTHQQLLSLPIPVIILEGADLDSACECVLNSWNDLLSIDNTKQVFVQENIYEIFIDKIEEKKGKYSISTFRNVEEGLKLANNNVQGLSASIWTENIDLAIYAREKLDVANVWINCFGIYSPEVPFTPRKFSGIGTIGNYPILNGINKLPSSPPFSEKHLNDAKKAQLKWKSLLRYKKITFLKNMLKNNEFSGKIRTNLNNLLNEYISNYYSPVRSPYLENYDLTVSYEPKGVIVITIKDTSDDLYLKTLISGLIEGNTFIIVTTSKEVFDYFHESMKILPEGVLNIVLNATKQPLSFCYYISPFSEKKVGLDFDPMNWFSTFQNVTFMKNIWTNKG